MERRGNEFPIFRITPVLMHYGGDDTPEGYGWRDYRCPFHPDSDKSGSVNTSEQIYNCHACADCPTGNAVQVIMKAEGIEYGSALQRAAEISGEGDAPVRGKRGRSSRMAGGSRTGDGARTFKRSRRSS